MNPVLYFVHGQVPRHKNRRTLSIIGGSENVDGRVPKNVSAKQRTLVERPPAGPGWLHQIKFDGIGSSRARTAPACAYGRAPRPITRAVSAASERRWRRCPGRTKPPFAAAPAGGRIGRRDERRHDRCGSAESGIIEASDILLCRALYGVRR